MAHSFHSNGTRNVCARSGSWSARCEANEGLLLAYVTGRHLSLAQAGIEELGLPSPDLFVCDVGTSVYRRTNGGYEPDSEYRQAMRAAFGGLVGDDIRVAIGTVAGMELQEEDKQAEFKVSYYTRAAGRSRSWKPYNRDSALRSRT